MLVHLLYSCPKSGQPPNSAGTSCLASCAHSRLPFASAHTPHAQPPAMIASLCEPLHKLPHLKVLSDLPHSSSEHASSRNSLFVQSPFPAAPSTRETLGVLVSTFLLAVLPTCSFPFSNTPPLNHPGMRNSFHPKPTIPLLP